jgi:hypothetical protein
MFLQSKYYLFIRKKIKPDIDICFCTLFWNAMPYSCVCSFALHVFLHGSTSRDNDLELGKSNLHILSFFHLIFLLLYKM